MICFPNAKINLGLHIVSKRNDGYHDIETFMLPIAYHDILEIIKINHHDCEITVSGNTKEIDINNNLCVKAYNLMKEQYNIGGVKIHLHKNIDIGAGLGGGSADAAFTIKMLNDIFKIGLSTTGLQNLASQLGSDCAFFIENKPAYSSGRGEILEKAKIDINNLYVLLVLPEIYISTAQAYSNCIIGKHNQSLFTLLENPIGTWKNIIENDFEESIFKIYPELQEIKNQIYEMGAFYASMSGSGSAMYGLFYDKPNIPEFISHKCLVSEVL